MLSLDTNLLLPAVEITNRDHARAAWFLVGLEDRDDVVLSELVLLELYVLLRNPVVLRKPLAARAAVEVCAAFRNHPRWQVVGLPAPGRPFHDEMWTRLSARALARRRAYDVRMALSLLRQGVDEFATVNTRDFTGLGFRRVWNPLAA